MNAKIKDFVIRKVPMYQAADGKLLPSAQECKIYNDNLRQKQKEENVRKAHLTALQDVMQKIRVALSSKMNPAVDLVNDLEYATNFRNLLDQVIKLNKKKLASDNRIST